MDFILTVPHSVCLVGPRRPGEHLCDYDALEFAVKIAERLPSSSSVVLLPASTHREVMDMNRRESRGTKDRLRLADAVRRSRRPFVLDIHSFDDGATFGRGVDLVVMDTAPISKMRRDFVGLLTEAGVRASVSSSLATQYDINNTMNRDGVPCLMMEVREGTDLTDIARRVCVALKRLINQ